MPTTRIATERNGALASPAAEATKPMRCTPACLIVGDHVKRAVADEPGRTVSFAPAGGAEREAHTRARRNFVDLALCRSRRLPKDLRGLAAAGRRSWEQRDECQRESRGDERTPKKSCPQNHWAL